MATRPFLSFPPLSCPFFHIYHVKVDEGGKNNAPAKKTEATNRKLWVNVKATSDSIEIDLDKNRPFTFDSKEQEIEWDRKMAKEALKLKELVESGQLIPDEIRKRLEAKVNRTPEEEAILTQGLEIANHNEKVLTFAHKTIACQ